MAPGANGKTATILLAAADAAMLNGLRRRLRAAGYRTVTARNVEKCRRIMTSRENLLLLFVELSSTFPAGPEILRRIRAEFPDLPAMVVVRRGQQRRLLEGWRQGAGDFLIWPPDARRWSDCLQKVEKLCGELELQRGWSRFMEAVSCSMSFRSAEEPCRRARLAVGGFLRRFTKLSESTQQNLLLVLEEAVMNALEHGNLELESEWKREAGPDGRSRFGAVRAARLRNPRYAERRIHIRVEWRREEIEISVEDEGKGFDPGAYCYSADGREWGMGLKIITSLMDEVTFNEKGNRICMRKRISAGGRASVRSASRRHSAAS